MEREGKGEGRGRRGMIVALLLGISFLLISCGNAGPVPKEGQAVTADGRAIDLKLVSKKIKEAIAFADGIKEVATLVKSIIDDLPQVIAKKIDASGNLVSDTSNKNGPLLAGVFKVMSDVKSRLDKLKTGDNDDFKTKIEAIKRENDAFLGKLKQNHTDIINDAEAPKAIKIDNSTGKDKGAQELSNLHTAIEVLLNDANKLVLDSIAELTTNTQKN